LILAAAWLASPAASAATDTSAVKIHEESSELPGRVTVWCLGNEVEFATAARALGIEFDEKPLGGKINFTQPGGEKGDLYRWAANTSAPALAAFDSACRLAYEAFSRSEARPDESESLLESQSGLVSVIVGALIAGASGAVGRFWGTRKAEARELTTLSGRLREAIQRFTVGGFERAAAQEAEIRAQSLRAVLKEWEGLDDGRSTEVATAIDRIDALLGESAKEDKDAIQSVYDDGVDPETIGVSLNETADEIHALVTSASRRVESPFRLRQRKSG
jgi:hypothetical protein